MIIRQPKSRWEKSTIVDKPSRPQPYIKRLPSSKFRNIPMTREAKRRLLASFGIPIVYGG